METRGRIPYPPRVGEWVAIHASKGFSGMTERDYCELCISEPFRSCLVAGRRAGLIVARGEHLLPGDLPRGAVIAIAHFARCIPGDGTEARALSDQERAFGLFGPGRFGWVFDRVRPLRESIPARGALGLWEWQAPAPADLRELLAPGQ